MRRILKNGVAPEIGVAVVALSVAAGANAGKTIMELATIGDSFRFAPHLGLFKPGPGTFHHCAGLDPVAQINFAADLGFTAVSDNFLQLRAPRDQEQIGSVLAARNMAMSSFVATMIFDRPTFASSDPDAIAYLLGCVRAAIEAAKRVDGRHMTLIPGQRIVGIPYERQTATIVDTMRRCADIAEDAGVVLMVEALNSIDRPGMMLPRINEAYDVVQAVKSPACRLVFDAYHVAVESGSPIENIDCCWEQIACIQLGDKPGRKEPGTGTVDFVHLLAHVRRKGYGGIIEMEHHASKAGCAGELAVFRAYVDLDKAVVASTSMVE